jgi:hypothetical protein
MRRLPGTKRTPIALVAALVLLSALLGDATAGQQATPLWTSQPSAAPPPLACDFTPARSADGRLPMVDRSSTAMDHRVEPGPGAAPRYLAGVPPWTIWPPAPVPRIGGAVVHPSIARSRSIVGLLSIREACATDPASGLTFGRPSLSAEWPEPFRPLERLADVEQRFPRPPPR